MARKRMIDPDFWTDEKLGQCKREERLLFMGLISNADDEGRGRANIKLLKAVIFPYDDDIKDKDLEKMICSLMEKKLAYFYVVDGQDFYMLPNFVRHQTINKPTKSKLPEMPENEQELQLPNYYSSNTVELPPKRKEKNRIEKNIIDDFFETIWKLYPRKEGKGSISEAQKRVLYDIGLEEMTRTINRYKQKIKNEKIENKFIKQGSTFFNSGYIDYLDCNYEQEEKPNNADLKAKAEAEAEKALKAEEEMQKEFKGDPEQGKKILDYSNILKSMG